MVEEDNREVMEWKRSLVVGSAACLLLLTSPYYARGNDSADPTDCSGQADRIVVVKSERTLILMRDGEVMKEYKVHLGSNPKGHKLHQGDRRTPEGFYFIDRRIPNSSYHLALHISYPDETDVVNARSQGVHPGGNILIHGLPNGVKNKYRMAKDWTRGCIAVSNEEIEEIWELVPDGTPIEIVP
jgi:murein L,D-transpeptidase YafK